MVAINKILVFIFVFACLFILREGFLFVKAVRKAEPNMTNERLCLLAVALSYVLTMIITGFVF